MDAFVQAFFAIDVDHSETITTEELKDYMVKNDMDPAFIKRWKELFDPVNTGVISLKTFCEVLGLELNNVRERYDLTEPVKRQPLPADYEEIAVDIGEDMKYDIIQLVQEGIKQYDQDDSTLVKWLKQRMDKEHGQFWHCMIVRGQYFSFYSYAPGYSFCFKIGKRIFILYKTPSFALQ
ncbi:hypothetical protein PHET_00559 [Paragonimus heterotremus]|uniref:EF-hand domain-containing protein n=1 Tax=Paragonimus heterotremus TaxID=100268 RepID=A0A8J4TSN6_9TREM|nr:hypothetical protein PHET_00559 [Paragonimus heterotremus]